MKQLVCIIGFLCVLWQESPGSRAAGADLQAAVSRMKAGDTLAVEAGVYETNLLIDRRLALIGRGGPVIHGTGTGSVLTITADSCIVWGFTVEHSGRMLVEEDAGILLKSNGNLIEHNTLRDVLFGIYLYRADGNLIRGNVVHGRKELELGERGSGIHIWDSQRNTFSDNTIADVRDGFYFQNASNSRIERNEAYSLRYGLHYMYADSNVFLLNSFHDNVAGAAIMYSRGILMRHNVFCRNRGFASFGILFQDSHGLEADSNVVSDNVVGMFLESSTDNTFHHNTIALNNCALQMFQNSVNNTFTENNFIDNLNPLAIVGKKTETRWSLQGRGNYWSSYNGFDMNGDGIGDIPMKIQNVFEYLEGQNPNLRLYLYSPASQALAASAQAFPIIGINNEEDPSPLVRVIDLGSLPAVRMAVHAGLSTDRVQGGGGFLYAIPLAGLCGALVAVQRLSRRARR